MVDPGDVRVSDADRQGVVDRLSAAVGDGLLTLDEFADHAGQAYAAVTRAELDAAVRHLQLPAPMPPPARPAVTEASAEVKPKRRWVVSIMSGETRKGRWRTGKRVGAVAIMGSVELDLRDALLEDDEVEITAWSIMGGVVVIVPEGIPVESSGFMFMGGRTNKIKDVPTVRGAPTVRVKGYGLMGGVDVRSKPRKAVDAAAATPPPPEVDAPPGVLPAGLVTIVCTDLVGSTRLSDELGDQDWRTVMQAHNAIVREHLTLHDGNEVKTVGDGFLCTFTSARRAVAFAVDVQDALGKYRAAHPEAPLEMRVGVHAGEVERDGDDVVGRNVSLACRLCDAAAPGEVLVSGTVADLADSSSDLLFGDARQLQLAGIGRAVAARAASRR
jgi:class 3 adenylate cyclase